MKRIMYFVSAIFVAQMFVACGGVKQVVSGGSSSSSSAASVGTFGTEIQISEAQAYAEEKPETRAWGEAKNSRLSYAKTLAEGQARASLARALEAAITTASNESGISYEKYAADLETGSSSTDEGSKADLLTSQIAKQAIKGAVVAKTNQYMTPNRQYHVFVCVEYREGVAAVAKQVAQSVKSLIPDDEKLKMDYQFQQFEKKVAAELEKGGAQ